MADAIPAWEIGVALDAAGFSDDEKAVIMSAINSGVGQALIQHIIDNEKLFDTLWADIKILLPAIKLVAGKLKARQS